MVDPTVDICVHEMCCKDNCGLKELPTFQNLWGLCKKKNSNVRKIRLPVRLDRKDFRNRLGKILKPDKLDKEEIRRRLEEILKDA